MPLSKMEKETKTLNPAQPLYSTNSVWGCSPFDWEGGKVMSINPQRKIPKGGKPYTPLANQNTFGWHPQVYSGPYAHFTTNDYGIEMGAGALNYQWENGSHVNVSSLNLGMGSWSENGKDRTYGIKGDATLLDAYYGADEIAGIGTSKLTANAEASVGPNNGLTLGAGGTIASVQGHLGKFDKNNKTDARVGLGLAAGGGAGMKLHWGDSDGDGCREYGLGLDIKALGGFNFDIQTEDPLGQYLGSTFPIISLYTNYNNINITEEFLRAPERISNWIENLSKENTEKTNTNKTPKTMSKTPVSASSQQEHYKQSSLSPNHQKVVTPAKNLINQTANSMKKIPQSIENHAVNGFNTLKNGTQKALVAGSNVASGLYSGVKKTATTAYNKMKSWF